MAEKRIVDNTRRPAQPEPGEDPATKKVPVREQGTRDNPKGPSPGRRRSK